MQITSIVITILMLGSVAGNAQEVDLPEGFPDNARQFLEDHYADAEFEPTVVNHAGYLLIGRMNDQRIEIDINPDGQIHSQVHITEITETDLPVAVKNAMEHNRLLYTSSGAAIDDVEYQKIIHNGASEYRNVYTIVPEEQPRHTVNALRIFAYFTPGGDYLNTEIRPGDVVQSAGPDYLGTPVEEQHTW